MVALVVVASVVALGLIGVGAVVLARPSKISIDTSPSAASASPVVDAASLQSNMRQPTGDWTRVTTGLDNLATSATDAHAQYGAVALWRRADGVGLVVVTERLKDGTNLAAAQTETMRQLGASSVLPFLTGGLRGSKTATPPETVATDAGRGTGGTYLTTAVWVSTTAPTDAELTDAVQGQEQALEASTN